MSSEEGCPTVFSRLAGASEVRRWFRTNRPARGVVNGSSSGDRGNDGIGIRRALIDGYAVPAALTEGAGVYMPVELALPGQAEIVRRGEELVGACDSVLPPSLVAYAGRRLQVHDQAVCGQFTSCRQDDLCANQRLLPPGRAGVRLRRLVSNAVNAGAGIPAVSLVHCGRGPESSSVVDEVLDLLADWSIDVRCHRSADGVSFARLVPELDTPWILTVGAAGAGADDFLARTVAEHGDVDIHGLAWQPGRALLAGRLGNALMLGIAGSAVAGIVQTRFLLRDLLADWVGLDVLMPTPEARLTQRISSSLGLEQYCPVRLRPDGAEPVPMVCEGEAGTLLEAEAWVRVPQESEGYPAGMTVPLRSLDEAYG